METAVFQSLISQSPGMAAIIIVVVLFLRAIKERDQLFVDQMNKITERLATMESLLVNHDAASRESYNKRSATLERIEKKLTPAQRRALRKPE